MFFSTLQVSLLIGLSAATRGPDPRCGEITQCYLVNLEESDPSQVFHPTGIPIGSSLSSFNPKDSNAGWSIYCVTEGKVDYVKYVDFDGGVNNTHYSIPWWANGDNSGASVNSWLYLEKCGVKKLVVTSYTWDGSDDFPCNEITIEMEALCDTTMPVPATTMKPVPAPTMKPVPAPTMKPLPAPTMKPLPAPTMKPLPAPTMKPIPAPTMKPVPAPTMKPVPAPTMKPVPAPTMKPVPAPTMRPVPAPTRKPVPAPTMKPVPAPTRIPVPAPTMKPVPAPTKPPTKTETCSNDCVVFEGQVDYKVIGNSMSYSEDRSNCNQKASSSAVLTIPSGARIEKVYLQWSGSGTVDNTVKLNGFSVRADKTFSQYLYGWDFFGAYADVTNLVSGSGTYTVSDLKWSSAYSVCQANAAYGAWSLVAIYSGGDAMFGTRVHVCQDKFLMTFPEGTYKSSIGCIEASSGCLSKGKFTIVTFESDAYKGEKFFIGGEYFGDNKFRGSTAPNLDINTFDLGSHIITERTTSLSYMFQTYFVKTIFGGAVEGMFDFVKVVKYRSDCHD